MLYLTYTIIFEGGKIIMNKSGWTKRLAGCLIVSALFICLFSAPARAAGQDTQKTIKVGVLNNTSFAYQDDKGTWRGSDIECMIDIAQKAGFKVEFVDSTTDTDLMDNLAKGKYDILADMAKGEDFKDDFLFTDEIIGTTNSTVAVRADDNRWNYGDIDQLQPDEDRCDWYIRDESGFQKLVRGTRRHSGNRGVQ